MKSIELTRAEARRQYDGIAAQSKYLIVSEGCIGPWGQGRTEAAALEDAEAASLEYEGRRFDPAGCWLIVVVD